MRARVSNQAGLEKVLSFNIFLYYSPGVAILDNLYVASADRCSNLVCSVPCLFNRKTRQNARNTI